LAAVLAVAVMRVRKQAVEESLGGRRDAPEPARGTARLLMKKSVPLSARPAQQSVVEG
jgi:hypothetical protein